MQMRVEAQPMDEPKRKLARLEEFIPDTANEMIYDFGRFVSVLNPRLIPKHVARSTAKSIGGGYSRRRLDTEDAK
jgi:hypothetical protein